ncbi:sulfite exporter TauE/SafE family protein [Rhodospirillaceae bacterium SYSU D60014]|uniref:sulfite exporter TauE/SafE family protein n=1 Tax=Virgifigura deserti TaxID=2268457 RepID=UPI000E676483
MGSDILLFAGIGFMAQLVDGALGMAFGVITNALLLSFGISPAAASASVHAAKIAIGGASGLSHLAFRNVDGVLIRRLVVPGVIGGIVGALLLSWVPGEAIRPFVAVYLLLVGVLILRGAWKQRKAEKRSHPRRFTGLGLVGGFLDAVGGGGWGPIVTSTLVAGGMTPRFAIGSVNLAEFFVAVAISAVFFATIGLVHVETIIGLVLGGVLAAPLGAYLSKRVPGRLLMIAVAGGIILLSAHMIIHALPELWALS